MQMCGPNASPNPADFEQLHNMAPLSHHYNPTHQQIAQPEVVKTSVFLCLRVRLYRLDIDVSAGKINTTKKQIL